MIQVTHESRDNCDEKSDFNDYGWTRGGTYMSSL